MGGSTTHRRRCEEVYRSLCSRVDPGSATDVEALGQRSEHDGQLRRAGSIGSRAKLTLPPVGSARGWPRASASVTEAAVASLHFSSIIDAGRHWCQPPLAWAFGVPAQAEKERYAAGIERPSHWLSRATE